ncbi:helix-turn-helix transcriptional regulator [Nocardia sp. CNY236]|uniref:helix-turn-helix domain-containing protein n=1 Tax=Nocardia sp. CNY236 TaxID=1169152 RepID=UPI0005663D6A|nr:helix-turn-helix transcriptional regulator [Nocardia sp. CNY236]
MSLETVGSALIRRHIGRRFADLRTKAGLSQQQAADRFQRGRTTIVRMEDGDPAVRFRESDVVTMLDTYRASTEDRVLLLALTAETRNGNKKGWWHDYTESGLPEWFSLYVLLEDSAASIRKYESELVPGLLQTERYAEISASTPSGYLDTGEIRRRVEVRMERQNLLARPHAPKLDFILNEAVIRRPVGDAEVRAEQLRHLLAMAGRPGITVRILPYSAGFHGGMAASAFNLLGFPAGPHGEPLEPPLAYVETLTGAMYLNKPDEVAAYELVWRDLKKKALSVATSREVIEEALKGLEK